MADYLFGVDVGGTTVKMGLFDKDGNVMEKWEIPTRTENGGEKILPDIADSIKKKMAEKGITKEDVIGAGAGVPTCGWKRCSTSRRQPWLGRS